MTFIATSANVGIGSCWTQLLSTNCDYSSATQTECSVQLVAPGLDAWPLGHAVQIADPEVGE